MGVKLIALGVETHFSLFAVFLQKKTQFSSFGERRDQDFDPRGGMLRGFFDQFESRMRCQSDEILITLVLFYICCPYFRDKKNLKHVKLTHTTSFHTWVSFDVCVCGRTSEHLQTVHIRVPLPSFQPSHHTPKFIFFIIKRD